MNKLITLMNVKKETTDNQIAELSATDDYWKKFLENVESALAGKTFYIKKDLEKYRG